MSDEQHTDLFDDGLMDGTDLARRISLTVPGINAGVRRDEWREDLKRRVAARMDAQKRVLMEETDSWPTR